jgi:hypothetical protein
MPFLCLTFSIAALSVWFFWRILEKAGFSGALALLALIPGLGVLIILCILAFSEWTIRSDNPWAVQAPVYWQQAPYQQQQTFYPPYQQPYNPQQPLPEPYYPAYPPPQMPQPGYPPYPQQMPPPASYP